MNLGTRLEITSILSQLFNNIIKYHCLVYKIPFSKFLHTIPFLILLYQWIIHFFTQQVLKKNVRIFRVLDCLWWKQNFKKKLSNTLVMSITKANFYNGVLEIPCFWNYQVQLLTTVKAPSLNNRSLSLRETATGVFRLDSLKTDTLIATKLI